MTLPITITITHGSARSVLGFYRRVISVVLSGMRGTRARVGQLVEYR